MKGYLTFFSLILFLILAAGFLFTSSTNKTSNVFTFYVESPSPGKVLAGLFQAPIFWALLLTFIFLLFFYLRDQNSCKNPSSPPFFEGFQTDEDIQTDPIGSRINLCKQTIDRLQLSMDNFFSLSDDTCNLLNEVEDIYLGSYKAPVDKDELKLPESIQTSRRERRVENGRNTFEQGYQTFNSLSEYKKLPTYSCKKCPESDNSSQTPKCIPGSESILANKPHPSFQEARKILNVGDLPSVNIFSNQKITDLFNIAKTLDIFTMNIYIRLWQLTVSLGYCESLVKKAIDSAKNEQIVVKEGFENTVDESQLITYVDELLKREHNINLIYSNLSNKSEKIRTALNEITNKGVRLENGDVTESEIKALTK